MKTAWRSPLAVWQTAPFIQVGKNTESREDLLETFRGIFLGGLLVIIVLGFSAGQFLTRRALKPIRQIISTVRTIADTGKVQARLPAIHTGDELDELSRLVNRMLARIETLITGMQATLDNVAHDLRTPMTRLRGMAEMALAGNGTARSLPGGPGGLPGGIGAGAGDAEHPHGYIRGRNRDHAVKPGEGESAGNPDRRHRTL